MAGKQGGKAKPLKAPKKEKDEVGEEDLEFKKKQQAQQKELAKYKEQLAKKK